jgi:predicted lipoprotein with Yx(FWY)xxD motif
MKTLSCSFAIALVALCSPIQAQEASTTRPTAAYPGEVALDEEGDHQFLFRRFPGAQRLYTYDRDGKNQSACNEGCDGPRPPVYAACTSKPMPDWTVVTRYNGLCQWAYKGQPLYTYYHDLPASPQGDGEGGVWHLLGYFRPK